MTKAYNAAVPSTPYRLPDHRLPVSRPALFDDPSLPSELDQVRTDLARIERAQAELELKLAGLLSAVSAR